MMSANAETFLAALRAKLTPQEYLRALTMAEEIVDHMATFDGDGIRLQYIAIVLASVLYTEEAGIIQDMLTNVRQH